MRSGSPALTVRRSRRHRDRDRFGASLHRVRCLRQGLPGQRLRSCFLCEIYRPTDALYVAPDAEGPSPVTEAEIEGVGLFGSYARALGWRRGKPGGAENDSTFRLRVAAQ
jgi:hypothetical protein